MNIQAPQRMTVDEYLVWALQNPGRFELIDGVVRQMSPETVGHAEVKGLVYLAILAAIKRTGLVLYALPNGATVRVAKDTAFEPDALVYAPPKVDRESLEVPTPLIIVEVISPSTHKYDTGFKLERYMALASVQHVLIVNAKTRTIVHHRRASGASFETTSVSEGVLGLNLPGLEIPVADFFDVD